MSAIFVEETDKKLERQAEKQAAKAAKGNKYKQGRLFYDADADADAGDAVEYNGRLWRKGGMLAYESRKIGGRGLEWASHVKVPDAVRDSLS